MKKFNEFNQELTTTELSNINGGFNWGKVITALDIADKVMEFGSGFKKGWNKVK